jgi:hypothetical protein
MSVVKAVDVFNCPAIVLLETMKGEDCHLSLSAGQRVSHPSRQIIQSAGADQLKLIEIPFATLRHSAIMLSQDFLIG